MDTNDRPAETRRSSQGRKDVPLNLRVSAEEKEAFAQAADIAGLGVSAWVRERLRRVARSELESANLPVAFIQPRAKE